MSLGYSSHTFAVRATDSLGNVEVSYPSHTWLAEPGLVLYYPFDGDLRNASALGPVHDGDGQSISFEAGMFGGAVTTVASIDSYAKLPGTRRPMSNDYLYTIGFWVLEGQPIYDLQPRYFINFRDAPSNNPGGGVSISLRYGNDHEITVAAGMDNASHNSTTNFNTWQGWTHILIEYRGISLTQGRNVVVYRDSLPWITLTNPTNGVVFSPFQLPDLLVGQNNNVTIDDLRVFNDVYSEPERCEQVIGGIWWQGNNYCELPLQPQ